MGKCKEKSKHIKYADQVTMNEVLYVPELKNNLFSITRELSNGAKIKSSGEVVRLIYPNGRELVFDYKMKTKKGYVAAVLIKPNGAPKLQCDRKMNIMRFHNISGHLHQNVLKWTAEGIGIKVTGGMDKCIPCLEAKMKKLPKKKKNDSPNLPVALKFAMDSTGSKRLSLGGNKYAHLKMCYGSRMIFVSFHTKKSEVDSSFF